MTSNVVPINDRRPPGDGTESGYAETIARTRAHELRYVHSWSKWIAWDGVRWDLENGRPTAELAPKRVADDLLERAKNADPKGAEILAKAAMTLRKRKTREAVVALARWEPQLVLHHDRLDRDADHLLVTSSGTVDLRTGELGPNKPERLLTRTAGADYDPEAECPNWTTFLQEIAGDDVELPGYLQRAAGYSITGEVREHVVFFLSGSGANGKSTFVEVLSHALGEYAQPLRSEALMASDHSQHPTTWAGLCGVRVAVASEIERGARLAESLVKSITGGDTIAARRMREDFWSYKPQFKLWILGNDKPVIRGTDDGIWRRLRLIPFTVSFVGREDKGLTDRLKAEAPGILRWAVDGAREWYAEGLGETASIRKATQAYRAEQDVFGQWVDDCLEVAPLRTASAGELRGSYETWTKENGAHAIGPRDFAARLTALGGATQRVHSGRVWNGLGLARRAGP